METSPVGDTVSASSKRWAKDAEFAAELERLREFEEIARQVIRLRMDQGLSQADLASRIGTTKSAVSRLESGQHAPNVETLRKIAHAFGGKLVIGFDVPAAGSKHLAHA